jgi:HlyD family secretion protein
MRRFTLLAVLVAIVGLCAGAVYVGRGSAAPDVATDVVSRGSIVHVVSASGTLEAVETVEVGTQVSGSVKTLSADFNSIVRKGQVLARLDPSLIQADIERAKASLLGAEAEQERLTVTQKDADVKLQRARELSKRGLIPAADLEAAEMASKTADAQVKAAAAQVRQARAQLAQAQVNLQKTVITSPIDGIVISRSVDVGQTVAASLQAPTLFTLAADLSRMQLKASIDESDLGNIREGQAVTFHVDAYPNESFHGVVKQIRLNPVIEQNVVTYAAIVSAPNPALQLKPGMTANLNVEVARRDNVLRLPAAAVRFKPSDEVIAALGREGTESMGALRGSVRPTGTAGRVPAPANKATVWIYEGETLRPVQVQTGVTDGSFIEVVSGELAEGTRLATRVTLPAAGTSSLAPAPSRTGNPLMGPSPPRRS